MRTKDGDFQEGKKYFTKKKPKGDGAGIPFSYVSLARNK